MNTRDSLTHTAGELFAKHGFDVISTRMIAEEAGVKLSAIHYHFGSKEKLYLAAFSYAVGVWSCANFDTVIQENPARLQTPAGQAEIIKATVFRSFYDHFSSDNPEWTMQILLREVITPSSGFPLIVEQIFKPDVEAVTKLYTMVKPDADEVEIFAWLEILHSHIFTHMMAKKALLLLQRIDDFDTVYYLGVAKVVARAMIMHLELPLSEDLQ